jgi:hypothetical protein
VLNNSSTSTKRDVSGTAEPTTITTELGEASITDPRLVYGTGFSKGDCINCGSKNKASSKSCTVCGYEGNA